MNRDTTLWNDTQAVSPVMATFVLILVGIVGAAGVAEMISGFSSGVADGANTRDTQTDASIRLVIAGSDVLEPITEEIAAAYMAAYPGVEITATGGGSRAGVVACGLDAVGIGAMSRGLTDGERGDYPDIDAHLMGGSAVVVIAGTGGMFAGKNIKRSELVKLYDANNDVAATICGILPSPGTLIVQRSDECGTEDMMNDYLGFEVDAAVANGGTGIPAYAVGNMGVVELVQSDPDSVGFVDYGFAVDNGLAEVEILGIVNGSMITPFVAVGGSDESLRARVMDELKEQKGAHYPTELARPMFYITNGDPDVLEDSFIKFAKSPAASVCFHECGCFGAVTMGEYYE